MASKIETDSKGIPLKAPYPESPPVAVIYTTFQLLAGVLGTVIAWFFAYAVGGEESRAKADVKISILAEHDLGWLYLGIIVVKLMQLPQLISFGEARKKSKVSNPDQHVYEVKGSDGSKLGYVLMAIDGVHGEFNRAQRAWANYHEHMPTVVLFYVAASWVFPFPAFVCMTAWAALRVHYALGYRTSVESSARGSAFMLSHIILNIMQGMVIIAAVKSF